jgi:hypothetical protein
MGLQLLDALPTAALLKLSEPVRIDDILRQITKFVAET